jgi:hypothetical protein
MGNDKRKLPRYFMLTPVAATVSGRNAEIIDLSDQGARIQLTERVAPGIHLPFSVDTGGASVVTTATVLWCELAAISLMDDDESDRYYCGIAFERSLSAIAHFIEDLVAQRSAVPMEETRNGERYRLLAPLTAFIDIHSSGRVLDISTRGLRMGTARMLPIGTLQKFRLRMGGREMPVDITATVIWSRPAERIGRFESGLQIEEGEEAMRAVIEELSIRNEIAVQPNTLERKFNPLASKPLSGLLGVLR